MPKRRKRKAPTSDLLFDLPDDPWPEPAIKQLSRPVWTENKAKLIEGYLYLFVQITKHGTYIDGFSGPQSLSSPETWAAKLALERQPYWLRNFHLFEKKRRSIKCLQAMVSSQPHVPDRTITIHPGDFNIEVKKLLGSGIIKPKEATFCLLDQRTFECEWETVRCLAEYKTSGYKIELFYFLPIHWLDRAFHALKDKRWVRNWWGKDDWEQLRGLTGAQRRDLLVGRFKTEFRYRSVKAWPIFMRKHDGPVMYYMIHATDHPDAPDLMGRAYEEAVSPEPPVEQGNLYI